ncbi:WD40 repeat-like protein [Serendipita vermifera]|nr:WD40 repeat-like protein [Serendipita vermifera]
MSSLRKTVAKRFGRGESKSRSSRSADNVVQTSSSHATNDGKQASDDMRYSNVAGIQVRPTQDDHPEAAPSILQAVHGTETEDSSKMKSLGRSEQHTILEDPRVATPVEDRLKNRNEVKESDLWPVNTTINTLLVVKESADLTPISGPLKATCGIMIKLLEIIKGVGDNVDAWRSLGIQLELHYQIISEEYKRANELEKNHVENCPQEGFVISMERYMKTLQRIHAEVMQHTLDTSKAQAISYVNRAGSLQHDKEKILELEAELKDAYGLFLTQITVHIQSMKEQYENHLAQMLIFQLLNPVDARGTRVRPIATGTRKLLIERLSKWANNEHDLSSQIFWLCDEAGTGKSALASHMAHQWHAQGILAARFFFDKNDHHASGVGRFCFSLAKEIAENFRSAHAPIISAFNQFADLESLSFDFQFKHLILDVLNSVYQQIGKSTVLVLDALDECDRVGLAQIASILTKHLPSNPSIKVLITSRSTPEIQRLFDGAKNICGRDAFLLDVRGDTRDDDIVIYITEVLKSFNLHQRKIVVDCARGLFLWASLACNALLASVAPAKVLERLKAMKPDDTMRLLYETVLDEALPDPESLHLMLVVLRAVALTFQPISIYTMHHFDKSDPPHDEISLIESIKFMVDRLASVMKDGTIYLPVHALHPTFREFLESQPPDAKFHLSSSSAHGKLAFACIQLISSLKQGMNTEYLYEPRLYKEFGEQIPIVLHGEKDMPLRYAATYWPRHAGYGIYTPGLLEDILAFFQFRFLTWVEWISALREIPEGIEGLVSLVKCISTRNMLEEGNEKGYLVEGWCRASLRFLRSNSYLVQHYPHQVHTSALVFTPQGSLIYKTYHPRFILPQVLSSLSSNLNPSRILLQQAMGVMDLEFSSDGQRILCVTGNNLVQIWNTKTGKLISYLEGLSTSVNCGTWSEDGYMIATGGETDHTIRLWDGITGNLIFKYPVHHIDAIMYVVFVLKDRYIVSSSSDLTIRRWPIEYNRSKYLQPNGHEFKGAKHTQEIGGISVSKDKEWLISYSLDCQAVLWDPDKAEAVKVMRTPAGIEKAIFSPDGQLAFAGCEEGQVYIWELKSHTFIQTLLGHSEGVCGIAASPDCRTLATGSLDRISFWDVTTGDLLFTESPECGVECMAFSQRGDKLVWGGEGGTLKVLEVHRDSKKLSTRDFSLLGHTARVHLIDISPDGESVVSTSSDKTFRMWDISDLSPTSPAAKVDHNPVDYMDLSADGAKLLTGAGRGSLQLWDIRTGGKIGERIFHSNKALTSLKLATDGMLFGAGYADGEIHVWKTSTNFGDSSQLTSFMANSEVICLHFSPDKSVLVSGSQKEMSVWDLESQCLRWEVEVGDHIQGITFSSNGKLLTTYMVNHKLQIWDCVAQRLVMTSQLGIRPEYREPSMSQSPAGKYTAIKSDTTTHLFAVWGEDEMTLVGTFEVKTEYTIQFSSNERYMFFGPRVVDLAVLETLRGATPLTKVPRESLRHDIPNPISPLICEYQILGGKGTIYNSTTAKVLLMLPREIVVCKWRAHGDTIALGLKSGEVAIIHIPEDFYLNPENIKQVEVEEQRDLAVSGHP